MKMVKYRCVDLQAIGSLGLNLESKDETWSNNQDQKK